MFSISAHLKNLGWKFFVKVKLTLGFRNRDKLALNLLCIERNKPVCRSIDFQTIPLANSALLCIVTDIFCDMQMKTVFDPRCIYSVQSIYRYHLYLSIWYSLLLIDMRARESKWKRWRIWARSRSQKSTLNRIIYVKISDLFNYCEIVNHFYGLR